MSESVVAVIGEVKRVLDEKDSMIARLIVENEALRNENKILGERLQRETLLGRPITTPAQADAFLDYMRRNT